jgi:hypothetical protein
MRYRLSSDVLSASVESEQVLLNKATGQYHAISGVGPALLAALEDGRRIEDACAEIAASTGHDTEAVRADCETFLNQMLERGLIQAVPESRA